MSKAVKVGLGVVAVLMALGAAAASVYTAVRFLRPKPPPPPVVTCHEMGHQFGMQDRPAMPGYPDHPDHPNYLRNDGCLMLYWDAPNNPNSYTNGIAELHENCLLHHVRQHADPL